MSLKKYNDFKLFFTLEDACQSIRIASEIRELKVTKVRDNKNLHPLFSKIDKSSVYKYW